VTWTESEMMIVASARLLEGARACFVGVGLPNIACNLARQTVAPDLELVYEAGVYGAVPARLPLSIGDPTLVPGSKAVISQWDLFGFFLQAGLVDVGFLGASQIDPRGNINTTVIGEYGSPKVRLPGSGGAVEIALHAKRVLVIMPQSTRSFVEHVDFVTSPGHGAARPAWAGGGPETVVTQLGVYRFEDGEMVLSSLHPGVPIEDARAATGWELLVASDLTETQPPSEEELRLIREVLDPDGAVSR
jgi:glutaconate CoA-transferase, subunit B